MQLVDAIRHAVEQVALIGSGMTVLAALLLVLLYLSARGREQR